LLPAGVVSVSGDFVPGQVVEIIGPSGVAFARGITAMSSESAAAVVGKQTVDLPDGTSHMVHRDDLVIL
jgi:glutamate 5-kinase